MILQARIVLKLASNASLPSIERRLAKYFKVKKLDIGDNLFEAQLHLPDGDLQGAVQRELEDLLSGPGTNDDIVFAEPSLLYHIARPLQPVQEDLSARPAWLTRLLIDFYQLDPSLQWHWKQVDLEDAWRIGKTFGKDTRVGVIDLGFDVNNDQINTTGKIAWSAYLNQNGDLIAGTSIPVDEHGTSCAGLVGAARDHTGVNGAAPECKLILVALPPHGVATQVAVARAVKLCAEGHAGQAGADVISCSLGIEDSSWELSKPLQDEIDFALENGRNGLGVPIVWAVFNADKQIAAQSLEAYHPLLCVAQSNRSDVRIDSGYGDGLDLLAPGQGVPVMVWDPSGWRVEKRSGSSLAAPCVAGVAALVLSVHSSLSAEQVAKVLSLSCNPQVSPKNWDPLVGWGRLNAKNAMELALKVKNGQATL